MNVPIQVDLRFLLYPTPQYPLQLRINHPYSRYNDQLQGIMPEKAILEIEEKKLFGT
jgi:hypothetical protein